ncbi:K02A2.6-like [Cordylochernes scorpioides]|uniref:RNA-directed DNA polymerase n=1 Tax=Cordylochernes scorpioides TaxID=51811 RepID=A0ABY6KR40_9ARAC|nr:K02A2.6-like [Cordylochernes scorpioides]
MLEITRTDPEWKDKIITGDETWVYDYDPETKRQYAEWRGQGEPRPKKSRILKSRNKVLLVAFLDNKGLVHHEYLPAGQTVIKEMYLDHLRHPREAIRKKMPEKWPNDIAPNDFFLFPKLKAVLKGRHFDTREDIIEKSLLALKSIPKELYKNSFDNLGKRWRCAVNAYKKFIPDYARLRTPFVNLLKRDVMWVWDYKYQKAFTSLKEGLTTHPTLHLYQEGLPCQVYCNASTLGIAGVLKQVYPDGKTYAVQNFSRSLRAHERNYSSSELECLAIVESVDKFRVCLMDRKFTIFSDHPALQWLKKIKNPSGRLFRWRLKLSRYEYEVRYINGVQQYETDVITRNPFCGFIDASLIKSHQPSPSGNSSLTMDHNGLHTVSRKGVTKIIVPTTLINKLLQTVHTQHNHPNISKMTRLISAQYYWQNMTQDIAQQLQEAVFHIGSSVLKATFHIGSSVYKAIFHIGNAILEFLNLIWEILEENLERIKGPQLTTISRRLVANGLHSCRPLRRLPLTPPNRRQRLEWCRARSTWMTEWHRVVFSDESRFCLSSDSRRVRVWRRRGERSYPAAIVERPTVRQRGIMVWGAIAYDSRSPLLRIQGTMTAQRYVDDVLRPVTLPYLKGVPNALYQQDNARPHTARISQQALQDVQMLPWPPYSPDLSPIEHVWDIIGAVCMPCHSRVQKTNCGKWLRGNGEPSLRTPSVL